MAKRPNLKSVANEAGVSVATASQVLRGAGRISEKTRKKVLDAAKKLHYVPDARAASMRSGENREIGFTIHSIANPFNAEVISGVSDLLETEGYLVSILDSQDDPERQRRQLEAFIRGSRGGLLWVPAKNTPRSTFDLLRSHRIPTVTFLRQGGASDFDHVGILNAQATKQATLHLAGLGHKNIAFLGGQADVEVRNQRIAGYLSALSDCGLGPEVIWDSADDKRAGLEAMTALYEAHPEVTGIVCNGDMVALGACLAMDRLGLSPGKDISIVGFDDIQDAAVAMPPLTTMAASPYRLGRRLARVLLDRINEPEASIAKSEITAELVVRQTTGPCLEPGQG